jgi:hypothetical protein
MTSSNSTTRRKVRIILFLVVVEGIVVSVEVGVVVCSDIVPFRASCGGLLLFPLAITDE